MNNKHIRNIGRRLKCVTICPLIIGIIFCSILTLTILYINISYWESDVKSTIETREKVHLLKLSQVRSQKYSSTIFENYQNMNFLTQLYTKILSGDIQRSENFTSINKVELDAYLKNPEKYVESVLMMGPYKELSFNSLENSDELDLFLVFLKNFNQGTLKQTSIILNNGYEFRYIGGNMEYILSADPCGTGVYDSRCLSIYDCADCEIYPDFFMDYQFNLTFLMKKSNFSIAIFEDQDFFSTPDEDLENYIYFLADKTTLKVYDSFQDSQQNYITENISAILESEDNEISQKIGEKINSSISSNVSYLEIDGFNTKYLLSYEQVTFESNAATNLLTISGISKSLAMKNYKKFSDRIYKISSTQAIIFLIFIGLALLVTLAISNSITTRITTPLTMIESYLRGLTTTIPSMDYNKEVNDIDKYLRIIETIEKLLDPRFLLHPDKSERLANLNEVCELFVTIKNNKGVSITKNLIGNIYLEDQEYDRAIDMYRESLAEMEALYNEVTAQEHAETKLSFEERKILKLKSGKETQNWETEKASLIFTITERIQQLYFAKQVSLEYNLESAKELRAEWKNVLDLQTKALQNYISSSSGYIFMLKVILDISFVYHKLQYFHTALELLDVVFEELTKLNPELTEQSKSNAKGVTIDIDITRLRRLSIKIKDNDGRKLYFHVSGISFERDVLKQLVFYRRALIYKENERFQEAALYFTMAIEQGTWYDPEIRKQSINHLYYIFSKFKLIHDEALLLNMYEKSIKKKNSIIFGLCYDVESESFINELIIDFVTDEILSQNENFGALTDVIDNKFWMECVERDYPGLDIENLISSSKKVDRNHVYDVVLKGLEIFPNNSTGNTLVLICKKVKTLLGPGRLQDIEEILGDTKIAVIALDNSLPFEFVDFLKKGPNMFLFSSMNPEQSLELLKKSLAN